MHLRIRQSKAGLRKTSFLPKRKLAIIFLACAIWTGGYLIYRMAKIDGGFSEWSNYSECSATCGNGTRMKIRTCTRPQPNFLGSLCVGVSSETITCFVTKCPVDGGFAEWSEFGDCSVSCGGGFRRRTRRCENPKPQFGGKDCEGVTQETKNCKLEVPCPIDGGFTDWSEFTPCSVTCGVGFQWRSRDCTNPSPKHGGKLCQGAIREKHYCEKNCTLNGNFTNSTDLESVTRNISSTESVR